jgi:enoyl-CoA hydratase/carnithine racemase
VLRLNEQLGIDAALSVESLAYSTLQGGPSFASWLASRSKTGTATVAEPEPAVLVERDHDVLRLTLNRPGVRNAVDRRLRDELCEALAVACTDRSVRAVELRGAGPAFSSGGDLGEFGTAPDTVTAHLARTSRSPARLLATVADRVTAYVHGACVGAGIELAAFAGRVVAAPDAGFSLPELGLGLIPGAGGTVSIARRVGRQRTAWLALGGSTLDATTARRWHLVDEVES